MADHHIEDVRTDDGRELYQVRPADPVGPAIVWLHWFDEAPNANRTQFLDEATRLADVGVVSLLPQLNFPWHAPPRDTETDLARIREEKSALVDIFHRLTELPGVDAGRLAMVGHDFGAMHGMVLFGDVELAGAVLVAPTPRWADWFLRFWPVASDRHDYMRALEAVDPVTTVARADCPLLFQFGESDFYIAAMSGLELFQAAPEPKRLLTYQTGHAMEEGQIDLDRLSFLREVLGIAPD
ncbi:MAG: hypothetical protein PVJ28_04870 [Acidimicrobiia bacterium]|jgi:pimeloyl-ACP methyl ester carboxylesterase